MINIKRLLSRLLNLDFYISPLDKFLGGYDRSHTELSQSQHQEINKYNQIHRLRDNPKASTEPKSTIWDKF